MAFKTRLLGSLILASLAAAQDCSILGGQKWASPSDVRACYESFKVEQDLKINIIEVANKTINFHTSTNYQIQAPAPFDKDVKENLYYDLARIRAQEYDSEYEFHIDISRTFKRLQDGHCVWVNYCYDSAWINYLPIPLSLITEESGAQNIHVAFEAWNVSNAEFPDQISVWQEAVDGRLESLSGARVVTINGEDPWVAVNANAAITGSYQAFATRQNSFFSSYQRATSGWNYVMGNFAQQSLPLADEVQLELVLAGATEKETFTLPYRSRIGSTTAAFTDNASYRQNNCRAKTSTNGRNLNANEDDIVSDPSFRSQSIPLPVERPHKLPVNILLDDTPATNVLLPPELTPGNPVDGGFEVAQFYLLDDGKTGVLALGSFSAGSFGDFLQSLLDGLLNLKSLGAEQLVVDVTNNGGGYICAAHWLHRIIIGPSATTVPQAGLNTTARAGILAAEIVEKIVSENADPNNFLLYNPLNWRDAVTSEILPADENWLVVGRVNKTINGYEDAFSKTLGTDCAPEDWPTPPPEQGLFAGNKVVIVSNGRCASSCSLFSITMNKLEGTKTVVVGGKSDSEQNFCGIVGGQSTNYATIDTEIKTTKLKDHPLAPPDLLANGVQGITWRLGYGIDIPNEPEEWQEHTADINLPVTPALSNNPVAIWETVTALVLESS